MKRPGELRVVFRIVIILIILFLIACHPVIQKLLRSQEAIYSVPIKKKLVALTYDDGPHPVYTLQILKILEKYHVRATFFMIGNRMRQYPALTKQVALRHVIGNHTFSHPVNIKSFSSTQIMRELNKSEDIIESITRRKTHIFRPPRGLINTKVLTMVQNKGYQTVLWSVSANHHDAPYPAQMAERVLKRIHPGSIILLHDGYFSERWKDVTATSIIITSLLKRGYHFVTIPELLEAGIKGK